MIINQKIFNLCVSLLIVIVLGACSQQPSQSTKTERAISTLASIPSSTAVPVNQAEEIAVLSTHTSVPSLTPAKSIPTPTPSLTLLSTMSIIPTLIPATVDASYEDYHLTIGTGDEADKIITRMEQNIFDFWADVARSGNFNPPYSPVWHATMDALLHFPDDPRADKWLWKTAYYMALSGEATKATEIYLALIDKALNQEGKAPQDLPAWFHSGELETFFLTPQFTLEIDKINLPGNDAGYLVRFGELFDIDTPGGSCMFIVENGDQYLAYMLHNGFPVGGFFITLRNPVNCFAQDVTDDGVKEIIVDQYNGGHVGTTYIGVFDLTSLPPKVMPFSQSLNEKLIVWNGGIIDYPMVNNKTQIQIGEPLGFCWDYGQYGVNNYQWNGAWFEIQHGWVEFGQSPTLNADSLFECSGIINEYVHNLEPDNAISVYEHVFKTYSPKILRNQEILEEFRVSQGIYAAYLGDQELVHSVFNDIIGNPTIAGSAWVEPSQDFLAIYQSPDDLYKACSSVNICVSYYPQSSDKSCVDLRLCDYAKALQALVNTVYLNSPLTELTDSLESAGVQIPSAGWYDFDDDFIEERWFTVMPPGETSYEFWIAIEYPRGAKVLLVADSLPTYVMDFQPVESDNENISIDFGSDQTFEIVRHPNTEEPFLIIDELEVIDPIRQERALFIEMRNMLFDGYNAATIYDRMLEIKNKYSECPFEIKEEPGSAVYVIYDCASFYYTLGLAAELIGKESEAIQYYYNVWRLYPDRPFAELARYKLDE